MLLLLTGATAGPAPDPWIPESGGVDGYEIVAVDYFGVRYGSLLGANFERCSWELSEVGTAAFSFHTNDADYSAQNLRVLPEILSREVQVWRDGRMIWWGVPVRVDADEEMVRVQCADLLWYFTRRYFGKADRTNLLLNPSFEDTTSGAWAASGVQFDYSNEQRNLGQLAAKLTQAFALTDTFIFQQVLDYTATGVGTLLTVVAWFRINNDGSFVGEAIDKRGLTLTRYDNVTSELLESGVFEIDGETPKGTWQRAKATVWMPPDATEDLEVRCYAPGGIIFWDATSLTIMESLSSVSSATDFSSDQAAIVEMIVQHAQDPAYDKNDLNIGTSCPVTGIRRERHYQFAQHQSIWTALREFPEMSDGLDFAILHPDPFTRTFTTFFPERGTYQPEYRLELGKNIAGSFRVSLDGVEAANNVTVASIDSDGPDREEGGRVDTSIYGVDLELVQAAPVGTEIDSLDERAAELAALLAEPIIVEVRVVDELDGQPAPEGRRIIDELRPGDTVDAVIDYGWVQIDRRLRVVRCQLDGEANALDVTLNVP